MKTITPALKAHMAQTVTTLAVCWQIVRVDGMSFAFTTADIDLTITGVTYKSIVGFSRTAIMTGSTGEVDNLEAIGFFDDSSITEQDLQNGLFNYATVYLFVCNWANLSQGICRMRRGWLGETMRAPNGAFRAELRGLTQALVQEFANVVSPLCRVDLGSAKCTIPIFPTAWQPNITYAAGTYVSPATKSSDALSIAIFQCTTPGTSGTTEPAWNTAVGATTADGSTLVWTSGKPLRLIGTVGAPVNQHRFVVSPPLVYPAGQLGNVATITFQNNLAAGSAIEFTDGINTLTVNFPNATTLLTVMANIRTEFSTTNLQMTAVQIAQFAIQFTNNSGLQGNIVKSGDLSLPAALLIDDFAPNYLDQGTVTWISGNNAGVSMEMKLYDINTTSVILWLGMNFPIQAGDSFFYYPGCDKRRETCFLKFDNILNFRGEPDVPGLDAMLAYPDASG
jgi:hypothetical protein